MSINPAKKTRQWVETVVVGLNLCPFAASVLQAETVQMTVCDDTQVNSLLNAVLKQLDKLNKTDETTISTSFLIFSSALKDFNQYLALVDAASDLLIETGLQSSIQIATFHPDYFFHGVDVNDVSNYSNRSPFPMLHFLRESQITKALENYANPEQIPVKNINKLRQLGENALKTLISNND